MPNKLHAVCLWRTLTSFVKSSLTSENGSELCLKLSIESIHVLGCWNIPVLSWFKSKTYLNTIDKSRINPLMHKRHYKARFIANSSSCTTTEPTKLLTSCLTAVKNHVIRYCEKVYERSSKNLFWSIKNSGEVLNKLKSRGFRATSLSTYDFSTLYPTLPHNLIKEKQAFFTSWDTKRYKLWSCQNVCEALIHLLNNIYIKFGTKLYRQIVVFRWVLIVLLL